MAWTKEQERAIYKKGDNILVAAAAGSGKTAVLVERIINKIMNENIDVDKLLVVTFTNAAATEMREKVLDAIYEKLEEDPDNVRLQKQIVLLNKSHISTIHAFCLEVIKNNFYNTDISPNFRLMNTPETELLKMETLEEVFENFYDEKDKDFIKLIDTYCGYRDDENLKEIILKIYKFIQSLPYPEEWLREQVEKFNIKEEKDFSETIWGKKLITETKEILKADINKLESIDKRLNKDTDLIKWENIIRDDICQLTDVISCNSWDEMYEAFQNIKFKTWAQDRKLISDLKEYAKNVRDNVKENIKKIKENIFIYDSKQANSDIYAMYDIMKEIEKVIQEFMTEYKKKKREKNIIDFNDIEHLALQILVKKNNENQYEPTDVAKYYQELFSEIAIDEYQDSNEIQEEILKQISKGNNIFMVGDVKQSIYKFRQARPEMFLEKYNSYIDNKILLSANFRSRKNILKITNVMFENIMSKTFGSIEYDETELLKSGQEYKETDKKIFEKAELHIINLAEEVEEEIEPILEKAELEANFVAKKIKELVKSNYVIFDKKVGYRDLQYKDIVVLLRKTNQIAPIFQKKMEELEIPVFSDIGTNYFESNEIQTILNILKIINNPYNDIALVSVLRSPIGCFTDNELIEIRLDNKEGSFYEAFISSNVHKEKIQNFLKMIEEFRIRQEYLKLDELIWYIYEKTEYYNYISLTKNGEIKTANLKMLFEKARDYEQGSFQGLNNFVYFIDKITQANSDMGSPKIIGENEDVVRIMSIHKSKGLEFPVVFICGTGNEFNMTDLNDKILIHSDLGLGPKYINYDRRISYNTLAKETIKHQIRKELKEEEMRLLYVALTRAREKLIITGIDKDFEKSIKDKENMIQDAGNIITASVSEKAKSYLDWIEMVYSADKRMKELMDLEIHNRTITNEIKESKPTEIIIEERKINENINNILDWKYIYNELTKIEGKSSVSAITKDKIEENEIKIKKLKTKEGEQPISKAEIGTIVHLIMQKLDYNKDYTEETLEELLDELQEKEIISKKQRAVIPIKKILNFTKNKIFIEIKNAEKVYREKTFYVNIPVNELYDCKSNENILVQGIIDLFYIKKNGEITLVDYKTDFVPDNNEGLLIERYKEQLNHYKNAIEKALNKRVSNTYIYSVFLDKTIEV